MLFMLCRPLPPIPWLVNFLATKKVVWLLSILGPATHTPNHGLGSFTEMNDSLFPACGPHKPGLSRAFRAGPLWPLNTTSWTAGNSILLPTCVIRIPACLAASSACYFIAGTHLPASTFAALIRLILTSSKTSFLMFIFGMI